MKYIRCIPSFYPFEANRMTTFDRVDEKEREGGSHQLDDKDRDSEYQNILCVHVETGHQFRSTSL